LGRTEPEKQNRPRGPILLADVGTTERLVLGKLLKGRSLTLGAAIINGFDSSPPHLTSYVFPQGKRWGRSSIRFIRGNRPHPLGVN